MNGRLHDDLAIAHLEQLLDAGARGRLAVAVSHHESLRGRIGISLISLGRRIGGCQLNVTVLRNAH